MNTTLLFQIQSALILGLMLFGIYIKRQKKLHVRTMSAAMIWDILLILQIELSRSAIKTASTTADNTVMLNIHVSIAITTVLLYGAMVYTGRSLLNGNNQIRAKHRLLGFTTVTMRVLTFITSFWAQS
jgi:pyrimidine operon attenuation protein/uracil phosphoribosyltransferase